MRPKVIEKNQMKIRSVENRKTIIKSLVKKRMMKPPVMLLFLTRKKLPQLKITHHLAGDFRMRMKRRKKKKL